MASEARQAHYKTVRNVLWAVLFANLAVTLLKLALGWATGALAVVADGFHSLVDTSSNLIGLAAVRLASRPADEKHPYGYRRYETIGSLAIGGMMLAAAWEITRSILSRLTGHTGPDLTPLTLGLVALTFPINVLIFTLENRAGKRLKSEILVADAAHTRTDLLVTASVIGSLVGVWLGWFWLDLIVAAGVVGVIVAAAYRILRQAAHWLTDARATDPARVEDIATSVEGVLYVHGIRSRGSPEAAFVDLHVKVHPGMSTSQAHAIASEVEARLEQLPEVVDALVHIEPGLPTQATDLEKIGYELRQIADGMGLGLHDLHVHRNGAGGYAIELHLEMPGDISLGEAHSLAEEFEKRVHLKSTRPDTVITHLEPLPVEVLAPGAPIDPALESDIRAAISHHVASDNILELNTYRMGGKVCVATRLSLSPQLSLADAHNKAEDIERYILLRFRDVGRVVVHVEPGAKLL